MFEGIDASSLPAADRSGRGPNIDGYLITGSLPG